MEKYNKTLWTDDNNPSISAEKLNKIEQGIDDVTNEVIALETIKELSGVSLNNVIDPGSYVSRTSTETGTITNTPSGLPASGFRLEVFNNNGTALIQVLRSFSPSNPGQWQRSFNSGNWGKWINMANAEDVSKRPYILESDRWSDGSSFTYYEKWSDGRLIMMGKKELTDITPSNGLVQTLYSADFHRPVQFVGLKNYVSAEPYLYDGINSFALFEVKFDRMRSTDLNGSLKVIKTSGSWTNNNRNFGIVWREEGFWK